MATKWADFLISAVQYDANKIHIKKVRVHEDKGDKVGNPPEEMPRGRVVENIENGNTFCTIIKSGMWSKGEDVHVISMGSEKFIRTDKNQEKSDNLGNLPEF